MSRPGPSFTESSFREAVAASHSFSEALRRLGLRAAGGNFATMRKYAGLWGVPTDHFDRSAWRHSVPSRSIPLEFVLVERSTFSRSKLKQRLYDEGLKARACELCGQGERWRGRPMSLILDHVNGVHDDNRLENLRIVCPNCNATLDTHCGKQNRKPVGPRSCRRCGASFAPRSRTQRYCSQACGSRWDRTGRAIPGARRVERPPYEVLIAEIARSSYSAVGRDHGVSDNAVRKWVQVYEAQRAGRPV